MYKLNFFKLTHIKYGNCNKLDACRDIVMEVNFSSGHCGGLFAHKPSVPSVCECSFSPNRYMHDDGQPHGFYADINYQTLLTASAK
jgi:hypothetical protein